MLQRSKPKDDGAATGAATICDLCDLYTQSELKGKWTELAAVYDVRLQSVTPALAFN